MKLLKIKKISPIANICAYYQNWTRLALDSSKQIKFNGNFNEFLSHFMSCKTTLTVLKIEEFLKEHSQKDHPSVLVLMQLLK